MALMEILVYPADPLTEVASPVVSFTPKLKKLAEDMLETMFYNNGVGLAAPQVGVRQRVITLCEPEGEPLCLVNPEIVEMDGTVYGEEGCLSLPELYASVPRARRIRVLAQDIEGTPLDFEACDFVARIIQHEYDHLQGKVFPDRLDILSKASVLKEWAQMRQGEASSRKLASL